MSASIDRRGACPTLAKPMQTGDGLLVRLVPEAGHFTPTQLQGLAEAAMRNGNGVLEVTARGSLQIRGLKTETVSALETDLDALGIVARSGVTIEVSPLNGLDPFEIADMAGPAQFIRTTLDHQNLAGSLAPKVGVILNGGGSLGLDELGADVRLDPVVESDVLMWRVGLAGTFAGSTEYSRCESISGAVQSIVFLLMELGRRGVTARGRDLVESMPHFDDRTLKISSNAFDLLAIYPAPDQITNAILCEDGLPPITPPRKGEGDLKPVGLSGKVVSDSDVYSGFPDSPPPYGEGLGVGVHLHKENATTLQTPKHAIVSVSRHATAHELSPVSLSGSRIALPLVPPYGSVAASVLAELAEYVMLLGIAEFRLAPHRRLLAICPSEQVAETLSTRAAMLSFITDIHDPRLAISACAGSPACTSAYFDTRKVANSIALALPDLVTAGVHISGCAKGCAHPANAPITLVGSERGVGLVLNANARDRPLNYCEPDKLKEALAPLAAMVTKQKRPGESVATILKRLGAAGLADAVIERAE